MLDTNSWFKQRHVLALFHSTFGFFLFTYAAFSSPNLNASLVISILCMITANFLPRATVAFFVPFFLAIFRAQAFGLHHDFVRVSITVAASTNRLLIWP